MVTGVLDWRLYIAKNMDWRVTDILTVQEVNELSEGLERLELVGAARMRILSTWCL